ncbi:hypothetical protein LNP04_07110 [Chryseobacterium sp. C-71]|uniref:hypothetical protein n=1 Tax=Chryseobacterium sp. C-71 TaxID=2893882 RepID=UPI001E5895C2|nr:hypothetical protein [Chryseobacterium sp. C-71]UFH33470.1 hypothetical protein LNP04_07110 [Chryseobacterium sp. C-71]
MLFPYKFVEHNICRLNDWIEFLFTEVWCNADEEYSLDLLNGCPDLKKVAEEEAWKEDPSMKPNDYITGPISVIYDLFKTELDGKQRKTLRKKFIKSRNLEKVLFHSKYYDVLENTYIESLSPILAKNLYDFYTNLFDNVLNLTVIKDRNGTLKNHYDAFVKINTAGICPFCGINTIRSYEMAGHEAYDHFLPKEKYATYSINFKNLVPTCHDCNSIHKLRKSPIFDFKVGQNLRAFYPYSQNALDVDIICNVNIKNYKDYGHRHLTINFKGKSRFEQDKINTWTNIYNTETRYKDHLTNESKGKYWLVQMLDELEKQTDRDKEIARLVKNYDRNKFKGDNLLKVPFLKACRTEGLF